MREIVFIVLGSTGVGKSALANAIIQKESFISSNSTDSCTTETCYASNIVNSIKITVIDTQGTSSSDGKTAEYMKEMVSSLNANRPAINAFLIVINIQNPRFDEQIQTMLETYNKFLNNSNCWQQAAIVFTRCAQTRDKKFFRVEDGINYQQTVKNFIKGLPRCNNINFELPCFFLDLMDWRNDEIAKEELQRLVQFGSRFEPIVNNFAMAALTYEDSFNAGLVQELIHRVRVPGQRIITTFAFGRNRTFDLDENGNVTIPVTATVKKIYEYHRNGEFIEKSIEENPIYVVFDFANMCVRPYVENQVLSTFRSHWKRNTLRITWRRKTELTIRELRIQIAGDFIFRETNNQTYFLQSPNIGFCEPAAPAHNTTENVPVPTMIPLTMR